MTDGDAKKKLREFEQIIELAGDETWLRIIPKGSGPKIGGPKLNQIGSRKLSTNPDGLYAYFKLGASKTDFEYCDVAVIEVCTSRGNFYDKRSRYAGLGAGLILRSTPGLWKQESRGNIIGLDGFKDRRARKPYDTGDYITPVRAIRVIYVLEQRDEKELWENSVLAAHEFVLTAAKFRAWRTKDIKRFIIETSHNRQFLSRFKSL